MQKFTADFETTTNENDCRVWAWAMCDIDNTENIVYGNSIETFLSHCEKISKEKSTQIWFHNLKFDGEFILFHILNNGFKYVKERRNIATKTFTTLISGEGLYYKIEVFFKVKGKHRTAVTFQDSLKVLPFPVSQVAKAFGLPVSKLEIDYKSYRSVNHELTTEEKEYIKNDVLIMALALNIMFKQGLTKMTTASNAMADYKHITGKYFKYWFPPPLYDKDLRQAYKGGFTYLNPKYKEVDIGEGVVFDVNSLYPSVMRYEYLPYGEGKFFEGEYKYDSSHPLYIQMLRCQFELKPNHIPTIQLKNNYRFSPTEYLESSQGEDITLCLTSVDLQLFKEHYNLYNVEYFSGWKFFAAKGMFDEYIDKWIGIKNESTLNGNKAMRTLAKLMLNSLYGKFASNPEVLSKMPIIEDNKLKLQMLPKEERKPIYIPMATFITAYARNKTIRSAQKVYDRFIYADTDSLHLIGTEIPDCLEVDEVKLGAWKHESTFTKARFIRAKTYAEEIEGEMNITCAGMPATCYSNVTWDNFYSGSEFSGKITPKHVEGGVILQDTTFTIKT